MFEHIITSALHTTILYIICYILLTYSAYLASRLDNVVKFINSERKKTVLQCTQILLMCIPGINIVVLTVATICWIWDIVSSVVKVEV